MSFMPSPTICNLNFEEMEKAGLPVKRGVRQFHTEDKKDARAVASGMWVHRWARQAAMNYPVVSEGIGIKEFEDCAIGIPVFCVGIGPSLDKNIQELKAVKGRALIFATDAALKPLLANGIIPQVAMTFDCGDKQKTLFENVPRGTMDRIFMAMNSCTHPDTIKAWSGPKIFYNQFHQQDEFVAKLLPYIYPHLGSLPSAGTVGNMLVIMAHFFGAIDIHLVGMDLCYEPHKDGARFGYRYRATDYDFINGIWEQAENKILYENDSRVARSFDETIEGSDFRTDPELKLYREAFVSICKALKIQPIDCSDGVLKKYFNNHTIGECVMLNCRNMIPRYRTVLFNAEDFFSGYKIKFDSPVNSTGASIVPLSEVASETIAYGHGAA
jgi:hypothetical protein